MFQLVQLNVFWTLYVASSVTDLPVILLKIYIWQSKHFYYKHVRRIMWDVTQWRMMFRAMQSFWSTARNSTNLLQTTKPGSTCYTLRSYSSLFYAFFSCFHSYRQLCSSWYLMGASNFNLYIISVVFIFSIFCSILAIKLSIAIDFLLDLSLILCGTSTFTSFWSTRIHFLIVYILVLDTLLF